MDSVRHILECSALGSSHTVVESSGNKYLCFTRVTHNDTWMICVTDGCDLWKLEVNAEELDALREIADVNTMDTYLKRFKMSFNSNDLQVSQTGVKLILHVGQGSKAIRFDLVEAKALEKRTELSKILFELAEKTTDLTKKLQTVQENCDTLKAQKSAGDTVMFDTESGKKKSLTKVTKQAGMSIINPGIRKRKQATGVQFE